MKLTQRKPVANVLQSDAAINITEDDVMIGVLPFFHIYGLTVLVNLALRKGATVVTMPRFDLEEFLTLLQEHRVTFACLVPPIVLALAKHPSVDKYDLSALERVMTGAAPIDADTMRAAAARLDASVLQGYGLTETSPVISAPTRDAATGRRRAASSCRTRDPRGAPGDRGGSRRRRGQRDLDPRPQVMKGSGRSEAGAYAARRRMAADGRYRTRGRRGYLSSSG